MRLTETQIQQLFKTPANQDKIFFAVKQEQRLSFHTEPVQDKSKLGSAYQRWIEWVKGILPEDKYNRFQSLITCPIPTNKQCQSIFTELRKVFDSQNGSKRLQFIDSKLQQDFREYDTKIKISEFMSTRGWEAIKTNISSFVVIDLPSVQNTPRPEPYAMIICMDCVYDLLYDECEELQYLIYWIKDPSDPSKNQLVVLDDEFYRVYHKPDGTGDWVSLLQTAHSTFDAIGNAIDGPGYVPARGIWKTASKVSKYVDKIGPVTNVLGDLDYLLFKEISQKYLGLYGDYPIIFTFKSECEYRNDQGALCEGGKVRREYEDGRNAVYEDCPTCTARKRIGPGSVGEIDAPKDDTDANLMDKPIHIAEISTDLLNFNCELLDDLEEDIFNTCVGFDAQPVAMAQNEKQVQKSYESKQNVLLRIASNIDVTEKFIYDTCCFLRYGRKYYLGSSINSGTEFYLASPDELDTRYAAAKTAGMPMYELANLRDTSNKTENRHNPEALSRIMLLSQLEPWPDLSLSQIQGLGLQNSDWLNFIVKINFTSYIDRFERENMNIVEFGSAITLAQKINIITQKLQEYGKESIASAQPNPAANAGAPPKPAGG